jgi:Protein of unknown function (DUF4239)
MHPLTDWPLWLLGILCAVVTLIVMCCTISIRRWIGLERLSVNNEVAGFKFATIGVLYAVLLGFAVIVVWQRFNDAENAVAQEAGAAATIYRLAQGLGDTAGGAIRKRLSAYIETALADDWPAMEHGKGSVGARHALDDLYAALLTFYPANSRDAGIQGELLRQLDHLTQARRDRLVMASGTVPGVIWFVLFGGAIMTISFTFFFGAENVAVQALMTGIITALIFSALLVAVAIDRPFTGSVKVTAEPLAAVLRDLQT